MIQVKAPGKLYIAGEYAVTEPGYKSVLIALDRFVTATIEKAQTNIKVPFIQKHYIITQLHLVEMKIVLSFQIHMQQNN